MNYNCSNKSISKLKFMQSFLKFDLFSLKAISSWKIYSSLMIDNITQLLQWELSRYSLVVSSDTFYDKDYDYKLNFFW